MQQPFALVGVTGFEPTTSTTPSPLTKCVGCFFMSEALNVEGAGRIKLCCAPCLPPAWVAVAKVLNAVKNFVWHRHVPTSGVQVCTLSQGCAFPLFWLCYIEATNKHRFSTLIRSGLHFVSSPIRRHSEVLIVIWLCVVLLLLSVYVIAVIEVFQLVKYVLLLVGDVLQ